VRRFTMRVRVRFADPGQAFERLSDFESYPRYAMAVRSVERVSAEDGEMATEWTTDFRGGVLKWVEGDRIDPAAREVEFRQLSGDLEMFDGRWGIEEDVPGRQVVHFTARFDLGIPTLEEVLEPIAEEALYENIVAIVEGLFGAGAEVLEAYGSPAELDLGGRAGS
jgi:ribosome-associated toxin RatA of RatAB toxin-antitoxin module